MKSKFYFSLIFFLLFVGGVVVAQMFWQESYITTLLRYYDTDVYSLYSRDPIAGNVVIRGELMVQHNNFATVKLRINTFNRMNTTHVTFRLKEKGTKEWYAVNSYVTDRFVSGLLYPFGFPPIPDSNGKTYEFEVFSSDGTPDNAIGIEQGFHDVATQYVFSKSTLVTNKPLLMTFFGEKIKNIYGDVYSILYLGMFGVPAIAWLGSRIIQNKKTLFFFCTALYAYLFLVYIYLPVSMHTNAILFIAVTAWFISQELRVQTSMIYTLAIFCLGEIPFLIFSGNALAADRSATLVFFLILIGVIMSFIKLK